MGYFNIRIERPASHFAAIATTKHSNFAELSPIFVVTRSQVVIMERPVIEVQRDYATVSPDNAELLVSFVFFDQIRKFNTIYYGNDL